MHTHIPKGCYMNNVILYKIYHLDIAVKNDKTIEILSTRK